ncbi:MAG: hydrolase [Dehalococcoidales bacterium]|nr:hydrolase [Dehalococcoidales bacterium]
MFNIENTALIIIDIQEKLFRVMHEKEELASSAGKLLKGIQALDIPVILTEQNPKGLGPTIPELSELMPDTEPIVKFDFSCYREEAFRQKLTEVNRRQLLVTGIETHICVYQTAVELAAAGYKTAVVTDCVSSRTPENRDKAITRMVSEGIKVTTTEMILFELLGTARHEKFRDISAIIK